MDFQSAMETFAEAWVAANAKQEQHPFNNAQAGPALSSVAAPLPVRTHAAPATSAPAQLIPPPSERLLHERYPLHSRPKSMTSHGLSAPAGFSAELFDSASSSSDFSEPLELTTRPERTEEQGSPRPTSPQPPSARDLEESQSQGRSLPVHCVVETVWSLGDTGPPSLEVDSYVIIPVSTAIQDLVSVALLRLGYSKDNAAAAKGAVVIRNWRPLAFDKIAESPLMTVGDILGELTSLATLRIQIFRSRPNSLTDMKEKLLKLLLVQHHSILVASGCPLDEGLIAQLVRGQSGGEEPSEETRRKFEAWWSVQQMRLSRPHPPWYSPPPPPAQPKPPVPETHPALQMVQNQHPTPKTRMRTSFDPELELPKLQQWFLENQHPSRQQIQQFVRELNSLESRRGRKPLDVTNVVYWFKNARAAQKRAEIRNLPPALQYKLMLNGYHSNSQSPSEGGAGKSPNQDSAETLEPLISPQASPQPPDKSPLPPSDSHEGSGGEDGAHGQDSISDSANNNVSVEKEESGEEESGEEEEDMDKDYNVMVKSEGSGERRPGFPIVPNSMFSHSIMYMSHYFPPPSLDERRKRNRTFIDPVSEVPRLEQWFNLNTHPSHALILKYTEDLNQMPYRQKFPPLEPKNVQFWFKNRRAKCKRLKMSLFEPPGNSYLPPSYPHHIPSSLSGEPYQAH